jgi:hypothetical protein
MSTSYISRINFTQFPQLIYRKSACFFSVTRCQGGSSIRMYTLSRAKWLETVFRLVIRFIGLLQTVITINYSAIANSRTLQFTTAHTQVFSVCYVFTSRSSVTATNNADSSASMFTSLRAVDCLIAPHGRNSWPLTPTRAWPPLSACRLTHNFDC